MSGAFAGYLAFIVVGLTLGLLGGGGAILTVPILVYVFKIPAVEATSYSLFIVGISSLIAAAGYARQKLISWLNVGLFVGPSMVGVYIARQLILPRIPDVIVEFSSTGSGFTRDQLVMVCFAMVMLMASLSMIRSGKGSKVESVMPQDSKSWRLTARVAGNGLFVGGVTGFVGAGGGFLIVPALVVLIGLTHVSNVEYRRLHSPIAGSTNRQKMVFSHIVNVSGNSRHLQMTQDSWIVCFA